jgi:hypothetical protein
MRWYDHIERMQEDKINGKHVALTTTKKKKKKKKRRRRGKRKKRPTDR